MLSLMFMPELAQASHEGTKTETRRIRDPLYPRDRYDAFRPETVFYVRERFSLKTIYDTMSPTEALTDHTTRSVPGAPEVWHHGRGAPPSGERWGRNRPAIHLPEQLTRTHCVVREHLFQPLHLIDDEGARREGFANRLAFMDAWCSLYGRGNWVANPEVHLIRYTRCPAPPT